MATGMAIGIGIGIGAAAGEFVSGNIAIGIAVGTQRLGPQSDPHYQNETASCKPPPVHAKTATTNPDPNKLGAFGSLVEGG